MQLTEMFLAELDREAQGTRKVLERVPEGRNDWKPHPKSMNLGRLATLVASMPSWLVTMIEQDELDIRPAGGGSFQQSEPETRQELLALLDSSLAKARAALSATTDAHLMTLWRLKAAGQIMQEAPRHVMIRDGVLSHLAHHRGQLTVYLRLNEASVPAVYGPSADES